MLTVQATALFALATLVMVVTPGPNMMYCVSRTLCQGRTAGLGCNWVWWCISVQRARG